MARTLGFAMIVVAGGAAAWAAPVQTYFTYQGQLKLNDLPITGTADITFSLWDAPVGGNQLVTDTHLGVIVKNGLFTATLDYGAPAFPGQERWLEMAVRHPAGSGAFQTLSPRQLVTTTPYAMHTRGIFVSDDLNVGIGTTSPQHKLHVAGLARFDLGAGNVSISTPGGWPGLIAFSPNGHRRDIIFDDLTLRLLTSASSAAPAENHGVVITEAGDVGIGISSPRSKVDIAGWLWGECLIADNWMQAKSYSVVSPSGNKCGEYIGDNTYGGKLQLWSTGADAWGTELKGNGPGGGGQMLLYNNANNVSAQFDGENNGGGARLVMTNGSSTTIEMLARAYGYGSQVNLKSSNGNTRIQFTGESGGMKLFDPGVQERFWLEGQAAGAVCHFRDGSGAVSVAINGSTGRTTTRILEITGGSDVSEPFDVASSDVPVQPGMVVCIDAKKPGSLVVSGRAYDRTVAGIVSGAGGVNPGLVMGQKDSAASGEHPVALTGRVYCWVDAGSGSIEPGDLLTTSDTPGHAMKVTDHQKAQGAILGKAMSGLQSGQGLVLVLVTLQ